jgi:hypothetical protein
LQQAKYKGKLPSLLAVLTASGSISTKTFIISTDA